MYLASWKNFPLHTISQEEFLTGAALVASGRTLWVFGPEAGMVLLLANPNISGGLQRPICAMEGWVEDSTDSGAQTAVSTGRRRLSDRNEYFP